MIGWWVVQVGLAVTSLTVYALIAVWGERKISAFIQDRLGPMEVGPYGALQSIADVIKLVLKEGIVPQAAYPTLFVLAPVIIFVSVFAGMGGLPFSAAAETPSVNVGLLYILGILSIDVMGLLMAGWGSNNKYALLGSARAVAQIISYEVPASLALLCVVMMYGSLDLQVMSLEQGIFAENKVYLLGIWETQHIGGLTTWAVIRYPHLFIAFVIYLIAGLAECNRAPFDLPEAESELVAGYHVEYSGFRFALMMLAEYGKMLVVGLIGAVVFLGSWNTLLPNMGPLALADWTSGTPDTFSGYAWGVSWLLVKALAIVFLFMWVRWTYPRVRVDQLMNISWKLLTPISLGLFLVSGIWRLLEVYGHLP